MFRSSYGFFAMKYTNGEPTPRPATRKLFLASFLALYFELLVIRYISTEMPLFALMKNLPLIACFLGLGAGMLRGGGVSFLRRSFALVIFVLFSLPRFGQFLRLPWVGWNYGVGSESH